MRHRRVFSLCISVKSRPEDTSDRVSAAAILAFTFHIHFSNPARRQRGSYMIRAVRKWLALLDNPIPLT